MHVNSIHFAVYLYSYKFKYLLSITTKFLITAYIWIMFILNMLVIVLYAHILELGFYFK